MLADELADVLAHEPSGGRGEEPAVAVALARPGMKKQELEMGGSGWKGMLGGSWIGWDWASYMLMMANTWADDEEVKGPSW